MAWMVVLVFIHVKVTGKRGQSARLTARVTGAACFPLSQKLSFHDTSPENDASSLSEGTGGGG
jgi:hypothetical protein